MKLKLATWFALLVALPCGGRPPDAPPLVEKTADGFAVPQPGATLRFPAAHGSHPDFRLEWWYITGHLFDSSDRRFGFQATFFRSTIPDARAAVSGAAFGGSQLYLAHTALLDVESGRFIHEERLNRDGWDAGAATDRLDLRNGNWSLVMTDAASEQMRLAGSIQAEAIFSLDLRPEKPRVVFGENGVSRKGADPTAASHYITFTRLAANGTLRLGGREFGVSGEAWMDHEIGSSQLSEGQSGWDWCSIQLADGRELMSYRLRRADGTTDPFSTLAWVSTDGTVTHLGPGDFAWETIDTWTSPATGGVYPIRYRLRALTADRSEEVVLEVRPLARAQELEGGIGGIAYWEGACDVFDEAARKVGRGFTELTGYAESLYGRF